MEATRYKLPLIERLINNIIAFIFYYRLVFVMLSISFFAYLCVKVWVISQPADQLKNCALVFTGGSIIIGIFYSIINYEHNQQKFKHDVKISRETLTFNTSCKMFDENILKHTRIIRKFYSDHQDLFISGKGYEIDNIFKIEIDSRLSLVIVLNYFEVISIGVEQGIMDEDFMKKFFKTIFRDNYKRFGTYIVHTRKVNDSDRVYQYFTTVAERWNKEN